MDAEKIYSLLFNLYAEQENIKIEYELNNSFFFDKLFQSETFLLSRYNFIIFRYSSSFSASGRS